MDQFIHFKLHWEAIWVIGKLQSAGFEAFLVGGAVRDELLGISAHKLPDYDLATNAKPEEILRVFPEAKYENDFGTVLLPYQDIWQAEELDVDTQLQSFQEKYHPKSSTSKIIDLANASKIHYSLPIPNQDTRTDFHLPPFEITTYRSQETYQHSFRKPDSLEWGSSITEDVTRRDFTINAIAVGVNAEFVSQKLSKTSRCVDTVTVPNQYLQVVDEFLGLSDLKNGIIRTVGDPVARFSEDALRLLRAIRFSVQLNMPISDTTYQAIALKKDLLQHISWERISQEFLKMLATEYPAEGIELLDETGLLAYILPELIATKGVEQGGHHTTDVWTHSLDALRCCPSADPIVRLATLLHDISKPETFKIIDGKITFYNHEVLGARVAKKVAQRLKLSKNDQQRIFILVRYHMFYYQPHNTDASIRRFMRKVGLEYIDDILDLREADRLGSGARKTSWRLEEMKRRIQEQLDQPLAVTDLAVSGHDLMQDLQLKPGPEIGKILNQLFEDVLENAELNQKDILLEKAKKLMS